MKESNNLKANELLERLGVNTDVSMQEGKALMSIIQCIFKNLSINETFIWDSELADASKDPQLAVETISCVCCFEKGLRIYLDR